MLLSLDPTGQTLGGAVLESWADTTSPAGELILTIMAGVAQFERKRIRERQREGIDAAKKAGKYTGGAVRYAPEVIRAKFAELGCQTKVALELGCDVRTVNRALKASEVAQA